MKTAALISTVALASYLYTPAAAATRGADMKRVPLSQACPAAYSGALHNATKPLMKGWRRELVTPIPVWIHDGSLLYEAVFVKLPPVAAGKPGTFDVTLKVGKDPKNPKKEYPFFKTFCITGNGELHGNGDIDLYFSPGIKLVDTTFTLQSFRHVTWRNPADYYSVWAKKIVCNSGVRAKQGDWEWKTGRPKANGPTVAFQMTNLRGDCYEYSIHMDRKGYPDYDDQVDIGPQIINH